MVAKRISKGAYMVVKSASFKLAILWLLICGLSVPLAYSTPQQSERPTSQKFPVACYFFTDYHSINYKGSVKENNYYKSVAEVYRLWCKPNASSVLLKMKAADAMAASWKLLWDDVNEVYDTEFYEYGSIELLGIMGITHQIPAPMVDDPKFTQMWMEACNDTCFTIGSDLTKPMGQRYIIMQLRLRNDVLENLKKEPASEPVVQMLQDARFRLVG
jgi:hypothetical protein